jgi:sugar (pentulose or hexulose) kinase
MVCDCLGSTTYRFSNKELGLLGIYRLILTALGIEKDATSDMDKFEPNMENHLAYKELYNEFTLLKESLMPFWKSRLGKE